MIRGNRAEGQLRDWSRPVEILFGLGAVLVGFLVAWGIYLDGLHGQRLQVAVFGVQPLMGMDIDFLWTMLGIAVMAVLGLLLGWVYLSGCWDRPLLGLLVFALYADVVPAIYQAATLGIILLLVERGLRRGDIRIRMTPSLFVVALIAIVYFTTLLRVENVGNTIQDSTFRMMYMSMLFILPTVIRTRRHLEILLHFMIISGVIGATVGMIQFGLSYVTGQPVTFASELVNKIDTPFGPFVRCTGLMAHPNHQGNALGSTAAILAWFFTRPKGSLKRSTRVLYMAVWFWVCLGCIVTWSRSTWLGLAGTHFLIPIVRWPRITVPYLLSWGGLVAIGLETGALQDLYTIVKNFNASSADFRWHMDAIAAQAFLYEPGFGLGVGGMVDYFNPYHLEVHNTYLQVAAELGMAGMAVFFLLGALLTQRLVFTLFRNRHPLDREWVVAMMFAAGIVLIQNMFAMFLWIKLLWFLLALMETVVCISKDQPTDAEPDDLMFLKRPAARGFQRHGT